MSTDRTELEITKLTAADVEHLRRTAEMAANIREVKMPDDPSPDPVALAREHHHTALVAAVEALATTEIIEWHGWVDEPFETPCGGGSTFYILGGDGDAQAQCWDLDVAKLVGKVPEMVTVLRSLADEVERLHAAIWKAYGILGFDTDGDDRYTGHTFKAIDQFLIDFCTEQRERMDEDDGEYATLRAEVERLQGEPARTTLTEAIELSNDLLTAELRKQVTVTRLLTERLREVKAERDALARLLEATSTQRDELLRLLAIAEPVITTHLTELRMDTPEDEALLQEIRDLWAPVAAALGKEDR